MQLPCYFKKLKKIHVLKSSKENENECWQLLILNLQTAEIEISTHFGTLAEKLLGLATMRVCWRNSGRRAITFYANLQGMEVNLLSRKHLFERSINYQQ